MNEAASFPAIRCYVGDWAYYSTVMPFSEVDLRIQRAKEINTNPGLDNMIQRELGERVDDIASYLRTQAERFFSAIVVGVYEGSPDWFPVEIDKTSEPQPTNLTERARESVGILQLSGDEKLFAVDGQHRVEGIKQALLEEPSLGDEDLAVLFVAHRDTAEGVARTRRLFTTLNKYAKRVTTSEIIALDEDDAFAAVTRMIVNRYGGLNRTFREEDDLLTLVKFEGAQLSTRDTVSITTVQMLYKLLTILSVPRADAKARRDLKRRRPDATILESLYDDHVEFWEGLGEFVEPMHEALASDPTQRVAGRFRVPTGGQMLFRPAGQEAFARALRILVDRGASLRQGTEALASTQLLVDQVPWRHVMWDPNRDAMNRTNQQLAESLLLYMVGQDPLNQAFHLEEEYRKVVGDPGARLADIPKGQTVVLR